MDQMFVSISGLCVLLIYLSLSPYYTALMTVGNLYYTMVLKSDSVNPLILFSPPKSIGSFIFFIYFHVNVRIGFSISIKSQQGL